MRLPVLPNDMPERNGPTNGTTGPSLDDIADPEIKTGRPQYGKLKAFSDPNLIEDLKAGRIPVPRYARIKPTNVCNHGCNYCTYKDPSGQSETSFSGLHEAFKFRDMLPWPKLLQVLTDFKEMGVRAVTYSGGGEPTVYPHIQSALETTLGFGIDLSMITHGQFLMEPRAEGLRQAHWVRISQDAANPDMFFAIRGNKATTREVFGTILKNAYEFSKVKSRTTELGVNVVVTTLNKDSIYEIARMWREHGANHVRFSPVWGEDPPFVEYHAPHRERVEAEIAKARADLETDSFKVFDSFEADFKSCGLPHRAYGKCYVMQMGPIVIGADQNVYFCHNKAYSPTGLYGSIRDRSFRELWGSPEVAEIIRDFDPRKSCRHQCAGDAKNIAMAQAMADPEVMSEYVRRATESVGPHNNFI